MFDLGWTEMAIIVIIGLIVIGPKDLPTAIRAISRGIARVRALADEFRSGFDEVMREAELDEIKQLGSDVKNTIGFDPKKKVSIYEAGGDSAFDMTKGGKKADKAGDDPDQVIKDKERAASAEDKGTRARQLAERMKKVRDADAHDAAGEDPAAEADTAAATGPENETTPRAEKTENA